MSIHVLTGDDFFGHDNYQFEIKVWMLPCCV